MKVLFHPDGKLRYILYPDRETHQSFWSTSLCKLSLARWQEDPAFLHDQPLSFLFRKRYGSLFLPYLPDQKMSSKPAYQITEPVPPQKQLLSQKTCNPNKICLLYTSDAADE